MGWIFVLLDVTLFQDLFLHQPQQLWCLHHSSTKVYLCSPLCSISFPHFYIGDNLRYAHPGFGVMLGLARALLTLFFAKNAVQNV